MRIWVWVGTSPSPTSHHLLTAPGPRQGPSSGPGVAVRAPVSVLIVWLPMCVCVFVSDQYSPGSC